MKNVVMIFEESLNHFMKLICHFFMTTTKVHMNDGEMKV